MFYQITYDGPGRSSRCSYIAKYAYLTPFCQAPEMTLNDLWPQIFVNPGKTGQRASICVNDINVLYCTWQMLIFEDILTQALYFTPVTPTDLG